MKDKLSNAAAIVMFCVLMYLAYMTYFDRRDCNAKGGVYIANQFTCINAEVL